MAFPSSGREAGLGFTPLGREELFDGNVTKNCHQIFLKCPRPALERPGTGMALDGFNVPEALGVPEQLMTINKAINNSPGLTFLPRRLLQGIKELLFPFSLFFPWLSSHKGPPCARLEFLGMTQDTDGDAQRAGLCSLLLLPSAGIIDPFRNHVNGKKGCSQLGRFHLCHLPAPPSVDVPEADPARNCGFHKQEFGHSNFPRWRLTGAGGDS